MSSKIGGKTPAQVHNDLFYLNNSNNGIDGTLRSLYSGNGIITNLKFSVGFLEADFNKGLLNKPLLNSFYYKYKDIGTSSGSFQIKTDDGNFQKIKLNASSSVTIVSDIEESDGFEINLIVEQSSGGHIINFSPSVFKTPSASFIPLSSNSGAIDVLKLITFNGGQTWLVYKIASDVR
jgi:hypothetical protein